MANTYTQIYIQLVFVVKNRQSIIEESNRKRIESYICGITKNLKCTPLSIYCNPDHTHFLINMSPDISVAEVAKYIKGFSSRFINDNNLTAEHFQWQPGYGAFSYSKAHIEKVYNYIKNQPVHHRNNTFKEEYLSLLESSNVNYNEKYLFDWIID